VNAQTQTRHIYCIYIDSVVGVPTLHCDEKNAVDFGGDNFVDLTILWDDVVHKVWGTSTGGILNQILEQNLDFKLSHILKFQI
jgi:hypothetical protein